MTAPALDTIGKDLQMTRPFERSLGLSIFLLASAISPFIAGSLSEIYGRRPIVQLFNLIYLVFNTACGFATTGPQLIAFRFCAGFGGSAATVIGGGVLGDVWHAEERGLSVSIYTSITLLGPTLGPLLGGFITQYSSWRWSFWAISIANACIQLAAIFFYRETFPPVLLRRKAQRLRRETGNAALHAKGEEESSKAQSFVSILRTAFSRPFLFLTTQPIIQVFALYIAYCHGLLYLVLTTFAHLWTTRYHETISISGLNYIALATGYIIGTQSCARLTDKLYQHLKTSRGQGIGYPEYRLPLVIPGSIAILVGLLWYGWSAEKGVHWIIPDLGIAVFAVGLKYTLQSTQLYLLDVYPTYAASAGAASMFLRSLAGFTFPLFAPYLYDRLGYGWGNSVLCLTILLIGLPAPFLLWRYGPTLRKRSLYATG